MFAKVTVCGVISRNPEATVTRNGMPFVKFTVGIPKSSNGKNDWYFCTAFNNVYDYVKGLMLKTGDKVLITGVLDVIPFKNGGFTKNVYIETLDLLQRSMYNDVSDEVIAGIEKIKKVNNVEVVEDDFTI